jgi:hypothetical protein
MLCALCVICVRQDHSSHTQYSAQPCSGGQGMLCLCLACRVAATGHAIAGPALARARAKERRDHPSMFAFRARGLSEKSFAQRAP